MFVASVLTRAQARKKVEEVNLADSLLGSVLSKEESTSGGSAVSQEPERETALAADLPMLVAREALVTAQKKRSLTC